MGNFNLKITDSGGVYTAEALHPTSGKLLGFIRFREKEGDLELTNFKAQLSRKALDLGVTSKRMKANQAGTHGEGFKVASLVMARSGISSPLRSFKPLLDLRAWRTGLSTFVLQPHSNF